MVAAKASASGSSWVIVVVNAEGALEEKRLMLVDCGCVSVRVQGDAMSRMLAHVCVALGSEIMGVVAQGRLRNCKICRAGLDQTLAKIARAMW